MLSFIVDERLRCPMAKRSTTKKTCNPQPLKLKADPIFPEDKLLRMVAWEEGGDYDPALIDATKRALHGHKVFSTVRIDLPEEPTAVAPVTIGMPRSCSMAYVRI